MESKKVSTRTPFELELDNMLSIEARRFDSEWLFKWHGLTYGALVEVDRFDGGKISFRGIQFGPQQQAVFWQAIARYLQQQVIETFKRWDEATRSYPNDVRIASIDGVERLLDRFVDSITSKSQRTASAVGNNWKLAVPIRESANYQVRFKAEVRTIGEAHRQLVKASTKEPSSQKRMIRLSKWIEERQANYKGLIWLIGIVAAVVSALRIGRWLGL